MLQGVPEEAFPASAPSAAAGVPELKLVASPARSALLLALLRARCRSDPSHPHGRIASIYYDTPDLRLLGRKTDSDFLKLKVRLRWYADAISRRPRGGAWFELKRKIGALRTKERVAVPIGAEMLDRLPLESAILARLPTTLARERTLPVGLRPLVTIAFERRRFVDPATGARVALDTGIHVARTHRGRLPRARPVRLEATVVEIKGASAPASGLFRLLRELGYRRRAFSKYARCMELITGGTRLA